MFEPSSFKYFSFDSLAQKQPDKVMCLQHFPQKFSNSLSEINLSLTQRKPLAGLETAITVHFSLYAAKNKAHLWWTRVMD